MTNEEMTKFYPKGRYGQNSEITEYRKHESLPVLKSQHYIKHVSAMTGEDLYGKGEIAEELAWRDMQIERQAAEITALKGDAIDYVLELKAKLTHQATLLKLAKDTLIYEGRQHDGLSAVADNVVVQLEEYERTATQVQS